MKAEQNRKERKKLVKWLDKHTPQVVKMRDDYICQRCGKSVRGCGCHWAHIYSRRDHSLRWDLLNALTLCCGCHRWFDGNGLDSTDWFKDKWPHRFEYLHKKKIETRTKQMSLDDLRDLKEYMQRKLNDLMELP